MSQTGQTGERHRHPLTCYLVKQGYSPLAALTDTAAPEDVYRIGREGLASSQPLEGFDASDLGSGEVLVVILSSMFATPWWQELLAGEIGQPNLPVGPLPARGAVVFCSIEDPTSSRDVRWLAWSFGIGGRHLNRRLLEPRFGVISALNKIIGDGSGGALLRKLQYREQGAYRQRIGHVATSDIPLAGFRMDRVRDMIAAAGGKSPGDDTQVFGGRSFVFRAPVEGLLRTIREQSPLVMAVYREDAYRAQFGFIDNYIPVEDQELITELEDALTRAIKEGGDNVDFVYPDDLLDFNDERSIEYVLMPRDRVENCFRKTMTIDILRARLASGDEGLAMTLRLADAGRNVLGKVQLRDCLSAEIQLASDRYYLADGTFYDVRPEFIERVDQDIAAIPSCQIALPPYFGGREEDWMRQAAEAGEFAVLDQTLISLPGRTPFEAGDLIHSSGAILHVKRKGRSSTLSYLFVQASISAQLLSESPEAVTQLRGHVDRLAPSNLRRRMRESLSALDQSRSDLQVILCILGDWARASITSLPLIAKLELQASTRLIHQAGFHPHVALVPLGSRS